MADEDPVKAFLDRMNTSNVARRSAWDAVYDSTDSDDLVKRLDKLPFSNAVRSQLWELKFGGAVETPAGTALEVPADASAGMMAPSTAAHRTPVQRFQQDYPDVEAMGDPVVPVGVLGAAAAAGGAAKTAQLVRSIPTRAKAGAKFEQVMSAVGNQPVNVGGGVGQSVLRMSELAERGGAMPKVAKDLLKRATDPTKAEPTYREMRDFYSNISRLSGKEMQRLSPVVRREMGELRVALDEAMAKVAASGGKEDVYRAAMKEYAVASKIRNVAEKAAKYGGGSIAAALGATAAYNVFK